MQVAAEVKRVLSKNPAKVLSKHFKLSFSKSGKKKPITETEVKEATDRSKSFWGSLIDPFRNTRDGRN